MEEPGPQPDPDEEAAVFDFLSELLDDQAGGGARPLAEYLARYPGHEEAVAAEFLRATGRIEPEAAPVGGAPARESAAGATAAPAGDGDARIIGHYRLEEELGAGGQGAVWLAVDLDLGRRVALKLMTTPFITEERRRRFRREAESIARLDHPGLAGVHDADVEAEPPWIAMRHVEGQDLARAIASARERSGPPAADELPLVPRDRAELARVLRFFERAARALHAAHEEGLVHRDIKPANLMITPGGEPVVLDFGLARMAEGDASGGPALTREGEMFGTPAYMAPEHLSSGSGDHDPRADVWALGVSLHEALTGERPFAGEGPHDLALAILNVPLPDPVAANPVVTDEVRVILATAMERDLHRRYPSALALAEDLRRIREFEPIQARPAGRWLRLRRWCRREPASAVTLAALTLGLALTAVALKVNGDLLETSNANLDLAEARLDLSTARNYSNRLEEFAARSPAGALALALEAHDLVDTWWTRSAVVGPLQRTTLDRVLEVPEGRVWDAAVLGDGEQLVAASSAGYVSVFDLSDGSLVAQTQLVVPGGGEVPDHEESDDGDTDGEGAAGEGDEEDPGPGDVRRLELVGGGREVLVISTDGHLRRLTLPELEPVLDVDLGIGPLVWMDSLDGVEDLWVLSREDGAVRVSADDGSILTRLEVPGESAAEILRVPPDEAPGFEEGLVVTGPRLRAGEGSFQSDEVRVWRPDGTALAAVTLPAKVRLFTWFQGGLLVADQGRRLRHARFDPSGAFELEDRTLEGDLPVQCLVRSLDGGLLVGQSIGGNTRVLRADGGEVELDEEVRASGAVSAAWHGEGRLLVAGQDGVLRDLVREGPTWRVIRAHRKALGYGLLPLGHGRLVSYGGTEEVSCWRPEGVAGCWRSPVAPGVAPARAVLALPAQAPEVELEEGEAADLAGGDVIVTAHAGGEVRRLLLPADAAPRSGSGEVVFRHVFDGFEPGGAAADPQAPLLAGAAAAGRFASAGDDGRLVLHDVRQGPVGPVPEAREASALDVAVSRSGTVAAAVFSGGALRVVAEGGGEPIELDLKGASAVAVGPAGTWVAVGDEAGLVRLFDVEPGGLRLRWSDSPVDPEENFGDLKSAGVSALDVSPDGRRLLASSQGRWLDEWYVGGGGPAPGRCKVIGHRWSRYVGDGSSVVAVGASWTKVCVDDAPVFEAAGSARVYPGRRHREDHTAVAVAGADGHTVVTASMDGTVHAWDSRSGALETVHGEHGAAVTDVDAGIPGHVVSVSEDGTVSMWPLRGVELARAHRPRGLSATEEASLDLGAAER
ncbi:MAG: serine/threonine-protein kinase [Planctomycetota bacterium]|jgi:serine/threonine protein kinase